MPTDAEDPGYPMGCSPLVLLKAAPLFLFEEYIRFTIIALSCRSDRTSEDSACTVNVRDERNYAMIYGTFSLPLRPLGGRDWVAAIEGPESLTGRRTDRLAGLASAHGSLGALSTSVTAAWPRIDSAGRLRRPPRAQIGAASPRPRS